MTQVTNFTLAGYFSALRAHPGAVRTSLCHVTLIVGPEFDGAYFHGNCYMLMSPVNL